MNINSTSVKARWLAQSIINRAEKRTEHFEGKIAEAANLNEVSLQELQYFINQALQSHIDNFCETLEESETDDLCFYVKKIDGQFRYIGITYELCHKFGILSSEFVGATLAERLTYYSDEKYRTLPVQMIYEQAWNGEKPTYVKRGNGTKSHVASHIRMEAVYKDGIVDHLKASCELFNYDDFESLEALDVPAKQIQRRECSVNGMDPSACKNCSFAHVCQFGNVAMG